MVYLIHFSRPYHHCRHYIGYCNGEDDYWPQESLEKRIERHRKGNGAKLLRAVSQAGIEFEVVRVWETDDQGGPADKNFERKLKRTKNAGRLCPVCRDERCQKKREAS